jgi:acyl-CoA thioester hydrolase
MGGIVYHSNYLNFCERARSEAFFKNGLSPVLENGHFVVKKLDADFIASAKLGDILDVKTEVTLIKSASFRLRQTIFKDSKKLFVLNVVLAFVSFDLKAQKIDEKTKDMIIKLFG